MHFLKNYLLGFLFLVMGLAFSACNGKLPRKKLPDFDLIAGWEDMPFAKLATAFSYAGDTLLEASGKSLVFANIIIPQSSYDSSALSLMTAYGPFAKALIDQWLIHGGKGILIDLRNTHSVAVERADLAVTAESAESGKLAIPVVLLWDVNSAYRANEYLISAKTLHLPGVSIMELTNTHTLSTKGRLDCFSPSVPDFDGP